MAEIVLPAACYAVPGRFSLVINAKLGDTINTIYWACGTVARSSTDAIVDPGNVIPSLDDLLDQIAAMEEATAKAEAIAGLTAEAHTLPAGSDATAQYSDGVLHLGIPRGDSGSGGASIEVDATLSKAGMAADAKAAGDAVSKLAEDMSSLEQTIEKNSANIETLSEEVGKLGGGMSGNAAALLIAILRGAVYDTDQSANIEALKTALEAGELPDTPTGNTIPLTVIKGNVSRVDGQKITYDTTSATAVIRACTNPIALYVDSGKTYKIKLSDYSTYAINLQAMTYSEKGTNFAVTEGTQKIINGDFTRTYTSGWKQEDILYVADGTADVIIIVFAKGDARNEQFTTADYAALNSMLTVTVE